MSSALSLRGVNAYYGEAQVLFDVALDVGEGEVVGLIGANGAGKSTTLKSIMGLLRGTRGEILLGQTTILGWPAHRIARQGVAYVPEDRRIFTDLTVEENLSLGTSAARSNLAREQALRARVRQLFPALVKLASRRGDELSGGEQQMLAVARSLMGDPRLLLLDEPTEGLAPIVVEQMVESIASICKEGVSVLLCEQNTAFAAELMHRGYLIGEGRIRASGTFTELKAKEAALFDQREDGASGQISTTKLS